MMSRLGVFGGMFDPVHKGHLEAAKYAKELLRLDCVKLIPCNVPNHRKSAYSSGVHRLAMLELVTKNELGIEVDDIELRRTSVSYSLETVKLIKENTVFDSIVFIMGMDSFNSITNWFHWEELFSICSFLVLGRSGASVNAAVSDRIQLKKRITNDVSEFFQKPAGRVLMAGKFNIDLSSTSVRAMLNANESLENCLNREVFEYINEEKLYR